MYEVQGIDHIEEYEPFEEGLVLVTIKKEIPYLTAFLTLKPKHGYENHPGYTPNLKPVDPTLRDTFLEDIRSFLKRPSKKKYYHNRGRNNNRGRGRGGRGYRGQRKAPHQ